MLITHGTLGSPPQVITDGAIYVRGDTIADLGPTKELASRYPDAERLDAGGKIVLPGNICAHTRFYSAFARGLSLIGAPPRDFAQILERLWWRLDRALDEETIAARARAAVPRIWARCQEIAMREEA